MPTITIVTKPRNPNTRPWIHNGTRWLRPHTANATEEILTQDNTPNEIAIRLITVEWGYIDGREGGCITTFNPMELRIRDDVDIWTLET